jgi:Ca2+-binding EF-hand superfamily protein
MNYRALSRDCEQYDASSVALDDSSLFGRIDKPIHNVRPNEETFNNTMNYFAMKFSQTPGIRLADYFIAFDKARSFSISPSSFIKSLVRCFGSLTELQTATLTSRYITNDGSCNYKTFINDINTMCDNNDYGGSGSVSTSLLSPTLADDEYEYVTSLLQDICNEVTKHRLLLKPTFQDFDRRNEDHVSKEQFMRALSMFHLLPQSQTSIDVLIKAFQPTSHKHISSSSNNNTSNVTSSSGKYVNYRKFLEYINNIVNEQERQQLMLTAEAFADVPRHLRTDFTPTKADTMKSVPYESNSKSQAAVSPPWGPAREEVPEDDTLDELTNTFDFGSVGASSMSLGSPSKASVVTGRADRPLDVVIADIRRNVLENRIRLNPFFEDHDKLRKGRISRSRFYRGLGASGSRLSELELGQLSAEYASVEERDGDGTPFVSWVRFVEDVNTVFTISGLETQPNLDVASTIRDVRSSCMKNGGGGNNGVDDGSIFVNEEDNEQLAMYLSAIASDVTKKQIDLFPPFEDFDRFHRGTVTANMFARVLSGLGFYPSEFVFELLVDKFKEKEKDSQKDVNYKAFIAILEAIGKYGADPRSVPNALDYKRDLVGDTVLPFDASQYVERQPQRPAGFFDAPAGDVSLTLEEIKRQTDYHCVRLVDFMSDGDRLRSGDLTTAKFRNGLARAGINLNASEISVLESTFKSTRRPADCIDWKAFLAAVDASAISVKLAPEDTGVDLQELDNILYKITDVVEQRRLNLKPYFQDYDKAHFQQVTQNQFSAVMSTLSIPLSFAEKETLFRAFMVKEGRKETNRVDYKTFMLRVDVSEGTFKDGGLLG